MGVLFNPTTKLSVKNRPAESQSAVTGQEARQPAQQSRQPLALKLALVVLTLALMAGLVWVVFLSAK